MKIKNGDWIGPIKGWRVRVNAALRCLTRKKFILVCWFKEDDGDITYLITHKGVELPEAIHRLKVDAAEILQDILDQQSGLDGAKDILKI